MSETMLVKPFHEAENVAAAVLQNGGEAFGRKKVKIFACC